MVYLCVCECMCVRRYVCMLVPLCGVVCDLMCNVCVCGAVVVVVCAGCFSWVRVRHE